MQKKISPQRNIQHQERAQFTVADSTTLNVHKSKKQIPFKQSKRRAIFTDHGHRGHSMHIRQPTKPQYIKYICFMREQIEMVTQFYNQKIKRLLQQQAKQLSCLRGHIGQNKKELCEKQKIIDEVKIRSNRESPKKKMNVTMHPLALQQRYNEQVSQMRNKIEVIEEKLANTTKKLEQKQKIQHILATRLDYIEKRLLSYLGNQIERCHIKIGEYIQQKQKCIDQLNNQICVLNSPTQQLVYSSQSIHNEITQLKAEISNIKNKGLVYQNYQIDQLGFQLGNLKIYVGQMEEQLHSAKYQNVSQLKHTQVTRNQSQQQVHRVDSTNLYRPQNHNPLNSCSNFGCDAESFTDKEDDIESQSLEMEDMDKQMQINEQRLLKTIKSMSVDLPLKVEIDQTGYMKCLHDGMYLVDDNHDGFSLTQSQIETFTQKGIIQVLYQ